MRHIIVCGMVCACLFFMGCSNGGHQSTKEETQTQAQTQPQEQKEQLKIASAKYTCPHCGGEFDAPGKCPSCEMDLVEKK